MIWIVVCLVLAEVAIAGGVLWLMARFERWGDGLARPVDCGAVRQHAIAAPVRAERSWMDLYSQSDPTFPGDVSRPDPSRDEGPPAHSGVGGTMRQPSRSVAAPGLFAPFVPLAPAARPDPLAAYRRAFENDGTSCDGAAGAAQPTAVGPANGGDPLACCRLEFARWLVQHGRLSDDL